MGAARAHHAYSGQHSTSVRFMLIRNWLRGFRLLCAVLAVALAWLPAMAAQNPQLESFRAELEASRGEQVELKAR